MDPKALMDKTYNPQTAEPEIYARWERAGYFHAEPDPARKPYCIVIPPPNITGRLHMGHALNNTMQDILIRFSRMRGFCTLWQPGTDHASIATEVKIIEQMAEEGLNKADLGRDGFLERAWRWREEYGRDIVNQLKKLGSSCDWSRERFTMDEGLSRAVTEVFVRLYEKGLIYRGDRIINWCPCCSTAISNAEVEYEDRASHLWHIRYPLADGSGSIVVATTRPETMLGDTAVAVHPDDTRYREMVGKTVLLPLMNREIPVIADSYVDPEFGTGAVKITPAHDPNDYEMALRHGLPMPGVIGEDGRMTGAAVAYAGMTTGEARERVVADLTAQGLLVRTQDYEHSVGACYRCGSTVEPLISKQWFVSMKPLAEPAIREVREGSIRFVPERFAKIYLNWMENIQDWCISRQLWWGHRIPAWYCACGHVEVARETPSACSRCGGALRQDEDVLDTWFSSALWPFSTLGWPDRTPELDYFYPTDVLVTAYDIIFFWVARMIFSGLEHTGQRPFHTVLIHGLVRDAQGRKMSKSLGNGIDPLDIIERYGADALRFSLTIGSAPGNDMRFHDEKVEAARNFANKIWNASRFVLMNAGEEEPIPLASAKLHVSDRWILSRLQQVIGEVTYNLERYELGMACQKIYDFIWSELCDWYIEMTKPRLYEGSGEDRQASLATLIHVLGDSLRLLHPFMPFVTEQIWSALPGERGGIMVSPWPTPEPELIAEQETALIEDMMELVRLARGIRAEMKVPAGRKSAMLLAPAPGRSGDLARMESFIVRLASASRITHIASADEAPRGAVSAVGRAAQLFIPLGELIDVDREKERVIKEIEKTRREIARGETMLANPGFVAKAPAAVTDKERRQLGENREKLAKLLARLESLGDADR